MTELLDRRVDALAPLRRGLLAAATEQAERLRADAESDGRQALAAADAAAAAVIAAARAQGEADARAVLEVESGRARQAARQVELAAQRAVCDDLRRQAVAAVRELLSDPGRHARLVALVRSWLGDDAVVRGCPDGGVVGETSDGRVIDASVEALTDTALADLDLEQLWLPT